MDENLRNPLGEYKKLDVFLNGSLIDVDNWVPLPEDNILTYNKNAIVMPISNILRYNGAYKLNPTIQGEASLDDISKNDAELDSFILTKKKCYNKETIHQHICQYINYWLKYYDIEKEYLLAYSKIKMQIDYEKSYEKDIFLYDIKRLILTPNIIWKVNQMIEDNYSINLRYQSYMEPSLQYSDKHGKIMMAMSLVMNMLIPITVHYVYIHNLDANSFLLEVFDIVLGLSNVDIYGKLYETCFTNISKNAKKHSELWSMQDIRGINATSHTMYCADNIVLDIMPKYEFSRNLISLNITSIKNSLKFKITGVPYEYNFQSFSSSINGDEDNNSEYDKYESYLIVQNEGFLIQNRVNSRESMKEIEMRFGPFTQEEINFYTNELTANGGSIINDFQKILISNLFFKYFGEPQALKSIKSPDYVKLMIAAKRILSSHGMVIMPYIISSKIKSIQNRKNVNKKESIKLDSDPLFAQIMQIYKSAKIREFIVSIYATIISSEFSIIDFNELEIHGKKVPTNISDIILKEINEYIILVISS